MRAKIGALLALLDGKKTYLTSGAGAAVALLFLSGHLSADQFYAYESLLGFGAAAALRHGVSKAAAASAVVVAAVAKAEGTNAA